MPPWRWPVGEQRVEDAAGVVDGDVAHAARPGRSRCRPRPPRRGRRTGTWAWLAWKSVITGERVAVVAWRRRPARPRCDRWSGVPATWKRPAALSSTTSSGLASSASAASCWAFSTSADRRLVHGRAAELQRARAHRALALGHEVGVAVHDRICVHRDAELVAGEHGEGGGVALPVRRGAGVDGGRAVGLHLDLGELLAGLRAGGDLDVERHADAELHDVAGLAAAGLLGAQVVVAGARRGRGRGPARSRRCRRWCRWRPVNGKASVGDEVDPPHLGRVHADLGGEEVHGPLDGGGGLGRPAPR